MISREVVEPHGFEKGTKTREKNKIVPNVGGV